MFKQRIAFLDLETTGADARADRITEVGMILMDDGTAVEEWSTLINPGREIPPGIEDLTNISNAMVAQAPSFEDVALDLAAKLDGRLLVAHNARFDYAFLRHEFRRAGITFHSPVLCTVRLSRQLFPEHPHHNLDALIERFSLPEDGRHRALPDARLVLHLTQAIKTRTSPEQLDAAIQVVMQTPRLPPGLDPDLLDDVPEMPGTYVLYDPTGAPIYAGKGGNLRTQVLAHFMERGASARDRRIALQTGSVEWTTTAGELGAALRHLHLVETLGPLHNRTPRQRKEAWALAVDLDPSAEADVRLVDLQALDSASVSTNLYGPFRSKSDAFAALRGLSRSNALCLRLIGLETGTGACSAYTSGKCRGACVDNESRIAHTLRLIQALYRMRIPEWPHAGPVAILERDFARTRAELHVARDWCYLGSAHEPSEVPALLDPTAPLPTFDIDVFRLLQRCLQDPKRYRLIDPARLSCATPQEWYE
jgi:DNA polymerase III subunit epsilon